MACLAFTATPMTIQHHAKIHPNGSKNVLHHPQCTTRYVPHRQRCIAPQMQMTIARENDQEQRVEINLNTLSNPRDKLAHFFYDAIDLGLIRFINISDGVVLETVGRFDFGMSHFFTPLGEDYLTIQSEDKLFECHVNTSKIHFITLQHEKSKMGGHDLYIIRLKNTDKKVMLSCLLQYDPEQGPNHYSKEAVDRFYFLMEKYGNEIRVYEQNNDLLFPPE
eukprot:CAMPEP_0184692120 /NCGR_PEP_ID=MMETSP0313-20130426/730_1 /TAXON_ID=2792 /ORGANISM="Porphyridium aerugineum, Strain SAG 1380-2" /LENGTH=220 /DNA_ID=CAMNT_0027149927 /DNA_START=481 /DNA_END=1143 /DNA_ORIENTATION=-